MSGTNIPAGGPGAGTGRGSGAGSNNAPQLPQRKKSKTGWIVGGAVGLIAVIVAVVLVIVNLQAPASTEANGAGSGSGSSSAPTTVSIGVTDSSQDYWATLTKLAATENITLEVTNFSDYQQPNPALVQKQTDLNSFQHLRFLAQNNVETGDDLVPIASTVIVPLGLYSKKWTDVKDIPEGGQIAIPNDPSNQARGLFVLEKAGLITLTGDKATPTPADIDAAKSKVTVVTVDAAQTALSLDSVDGSIINNNYVADAGLDPNKAIFKDDPKDPGATPYINVIVARGADADNPAYLKVAELWHDKSVTDQVLAASKGSAVLVEGWTPEELRAELKKIEEQLKASE
jgi:D-methionine transport system substrate-binding protein